MSFSKFLIKAGFFIFLFLWFTSASMTVAYANEVSASRKKESPIDQLKKILKKQEKPKKIEAGPGLISSKQMKSYCQKELKTLNLKIAELDGRITKSKSVYEQRKQEAWALFLEQSKLERSNEQDTDRILDLHEKLSNAKAAEADALEEYRSDARELLNAQRKIEQCQDEIKKANKILDFTGQSR